MNLAVEQWTTGDELGLEKGIGSEASGSPKPVPTPGYRGIITVPGSTRSARRYQQHCQQFPGCFQSIKSKPPAICRLGLTRLTRLRKPLAASSTVLGLPTSWKISLEGFFFGGEMELIYVQKIYKEIADPPYTNLWLAPENNIKVSKEHEEYTLLNR